MFIISIQAIDYENQWRRWSAKPSKKETFETFGRE